MKRTLLVLMVALLALVGSSVGLAQNLGPGIRWGPPSGLVDVPVGIPGQTWLVPPPVATFPVGDLIIAVDAATAIYPHPTLGASYTLLPNSVGSPDMDAYRGVPSAGVIQVASGGFIYTVFPGISYSGITYGAGVTSWTAVCKVSCETDTETAVPFCYYNGLTGVDRTVLLRPSSSVDATIGATSFDLNTVGTVGSLTSGIKTFVVRNDGANFVTFIDGVQVGTAAASLGVINSWWVVIGERLNGVYPGYTVNNYADANPVSMEKFYLYFRALSDAEITGTSW